MGTDLRYRKNFHVDLRDVDFKKELKLSALFTYFQEIASEASEQLGVGIEQLEREFHVAWVLVRMRVEILRNPKWNETITIESWPLEPNRVEFYRDFLVRDEGGNVIIKAISTWVIMDIHNRRLKRTDYIKLVYPENISERAIDRKMGKLKDFGNPEESYKKVIAYSDIDFNGHLNNSNYVDYILDCFPIEEHKKYTVRAIEVNFIQEALPGDTLTVQRDLSALSSNLIYIEGINEQGYSIFKAQLEIGER